MQKTKDTKSLRFLTKGTIWDMQESDIFFMWQKPDKEDAAQEHAEHYMDIIKTAVKVDWHVRLKKNMRHVVCVSVLFLSDTRNRSGQ